MSKPDPNEDSQPVFALKKGEKVAGDRIKRSFFNRLGHQSKNLLRTFYKALSIDDTGHTEAWQKISQKLRELDRQEKKADQKATLEFVQDELQKTIKEIVRSEVQKELEQHRCNFVKQEKP